MTVAYEHVVQPGERWDLIAMRYYGDPSRSDVLLAANRTRYAPDTAVRSFSVPVPILRAGDVLTVPEITTTVDDSLLPPWKRGQSIAS